MVVGNGVRAAVVFLPESGRVEWPHWAHPGAGLLVHGCVLAGVFGIGGRLDLLGRRCGGSRWWRLVRRLAVAGFVILLVSGGMFAATHGTGRESSASQSTGWPAMLDGVALVRRPLSAAEKGFARAFPGSIAKFAWGEAEVILRRTDRATRMMHPAGDCLRAAGFETRSEPVFRDADGRLWGASTALRDGRRWRVHERYLPADGDAVHRRLGVVLAGVASPRAGAMDGDHGG